MIRYCYFQVIEVDTIAETETQKQAHILWAWIQLSSPMDSWHNDGRDVLRHLDGATCGSEESVWDLESLMAHASAL